MLAHKFVERWVEVENNWRTYLTNSLWWLLRRTSQVSVPLTDEDWELINTFTEVSDAWISMEASVVINRVKMCLYTGTAGDAPLDAVQITGFWLLYNSHTHDEGFLTVTMKGFNVIDNRVGRPADLVFGDSHSPSDGDQGRTWSPLITGSDSRPFPSMLSLHMTFGRSSTSVSVSIQRPQLIVSLDFLRGVVEFFVPTIDSVLPIEKDLNMVDAVIMDNFIYTQQTAKAFLSPLAPLIVENENFRDFIYDGNGKTLYLNDRHGVILSSPSTEPIIYVGSGKSLQFRNVVFKNCQVLDSCISLGARSSYSVSKEDGVELEVYHKAPQQDSGRSMAFIIDFQVLTVANFLGLETKRSLYFIR